MGVWRWGEREIIIIYLSLHCHHQNDSCIKIRWTAMRAILTFQQAVMDKVTGQCPQTTTFLKRKESRSGIEPRSFQLTSLTPYRWAKPAHGPEIDDDDEMMLNVLKCRLTY